MLSIEEGTDHIFESDAQIPYELRSFLGHGHSGAVAKVEDIKTGRFYARKTIHVRWTRLRVDREKTFKNEVDIIRSLKRHPHIIRVFATYMTKREFNMILEPVADCGNLHEFLLDFRDKLLAVNEPTDPALALMTQVLERAFGCLAGGLAFMHEQRVRHKDIKPQNILVHEGKVIYTDFGYALDCNGFSSSNSSGSSSAFTKRYAAPEVFTYPPQPRNSSSDVFSLGCVFFEILSTLSSAIDIDEDHGFSEVLTRLHEQLSDADIPAHLAFVSGTIIMMTMRNARSRWKAYQVYQEIRQHPGFDCPECQPPPSISKTFSKETMGRCEIQQTKPATENLEDCVQPDAHIIHPPRTKEVCQLEPFGELELAQLTSFTCSRDDISLAWNHSAYCDALDLQDLLPSPPPGKLRMINAWLLEMVDTSPVQIAHLKAMDGSEDMEFGAWREKLRLTWVCDEIGVPPEFHTGDTTDSGSLASQHISTSTVDITELEMCFTTCRNSRPMDRKVDVPEPGNIPTSIEPGDLLGVDTQVQPSLPPAFNASDENSCSITTSKIPSRRTSCSDVINTDTDTTSNRSCTCAECANLGEHALGRLHHTHSSNTTPRTESKSQYATAAIIEQASIRRKSTSLSPEPRTTVKHNFNTVASDISQRQFNTPPELRSGSNNSRCLIM